MSVMNQIQAKFGAHAPYMLSILFVRNMPVFMMMLIQFDTELRTSMEKTKIYGDRPLDTILDMHEMKIRKFFQTSIDKYKGLPLVPDYLVYMYVKMLKAKSMPEGVERDTSIKMLTDSISRSSSSSSILLDLD